MVTMSNGMLDVRVDAGPSLAPNLVCPACGQSFYSAAAVQIEGQRCGAAGCSGVIGPIGA